MNPRFTIAIIVGAFLLGLGIVFGFALGRRTAFFASQFPSTVGEKAAAPRPAAGSMQSGTISAIDDRAVIISLDGGKRVTIERSDIVAVAAVRPLAPEAFARSLEAYRSALRRGDQKATPPSDSTIVSLNISDLKEGMRIDVEDNEGKKKVWISR